MPLSFSPLEKKVASIVMWNDWSTRGPLGNANFSQKMLEAFRQFSSEKKKDFFTTVRQDDSKFKLPFPGGNNVLLRSIQMNAQLSAINVLTPIEMIETCEVSHQAEVWKFTNEAGHNAFTLTARLFNARIQRIVQSIARLEKADQAAIVLHVTREGRTALAEALAKPILSPPAVGYILEAIKNLDVSDQQQAFKQLKPVDWINLEKAMAENGDFPTTLLNEIFDSFSRSGKVEEDLLNQVVRCSLQIGAWNLPRHVEEALKDPGPKEVDRIIEPFYRIAFKQSDRTLLAHNKDTIKTYLRLKYFTHSSQIDMEELLAVDQVFGAADWQEITVQDAQKGVRDAIIQKIAFDLKKLSIFHIVKKQRLRQLCDHLAASTVSFGATALVLHPAAVAGQPKNLLKGSDKRGPVKDGKAKVVRFSSEQSEESEQSNLNC